MRIEEDFLGKVKIEDDAYYGAETERALENFKISGITVSKYFIKHYAYLKLSMAKANMKIGKLNKEKGDAIVKACREIIEGKHDKEFKLDIFQAGAGTSTNMNLNEVIANRATELLKGKKGSYIVNPNDDVNMAQSTNDTYHSAMHISLLMKTIELLEELERFERSIEEKAKEFRPIVKVGRTHLQDAVPISLGSEFEGYAGSLGMAKEVIRGAANMLRSLPIAGTAVGTGINAQKELRPIVCEILSKELKQRFFPSKNIFAVMQNVNEELVLSNSLLFLGVVLSKISNDLRLLGSGPRGGIGEIIIPPVQPGSSIMPGKVNPSMLEMLNMVCFHVIGSCTTVEHAAISSQLELNVFMPIVSQHLLFSESILASALRSVREKCIKGIKANEKRIKEILDNDLGMATALSPYIGYAKASEIALKAYREGKTIKEVCLEMGIMKKEELERVLDPKKQL
ncbi:MAG: aspartate ammonia-lyase [Candidatus Micrarchaeaceae archaeon]